MEVSKVIHALYTDDDVLMSAVKKVKSEKYHIEEVYTPFPVHPKGLIQRRAQGQPQTGDTLQKGS